MVMSWRCNFTIAKKRASYVLLCTKRNVKCFNLQFHVHHYYHQFFMSDVLGFGRLYNIVLPENWWSIEARERKRFFGAQVFLLITCLWIINWRILMFLFSLRSSFLVLQVLLNTCYPTLGRPLKVMSWKLRSSRVKRRYGLSDDNLSGISIVVEHHRNVREWSKSLEYFHSQLATIAAFLIKSIDVLRSWRHSKKN